jgi:hypothetical protein
VTSRSRRVSSRWLLGPGVAALALALAGCASATGGDGDDDVGGIDAAIADAPPGTPDAPPGTPDAPPGTPDAMPGVPDAMPMPPDASTGLPCSSGAVCSGAMTLPAISGDMGSQKQIAQGYQSAWYKIRVTEDVGGITGVSTSAEVKLTSPVGADFDVFVYLNPDSDVSQECSMTYGTKTTNGNVETVLADWGETNGGLANGAGDSRTMSIEIRPVSGTCSVGQVWQLEVTGNQ